MKVYLHIGSPKTGTTTLQEFLNTNREQLLENGIYYPKSTGENNHMSLVIAAYDQYRDDGVERLLGIRNDEQIIQLRKSITENLRAEIASLSSHVDTIVFSSEYFHLNLLTHQEVARVKEIFNNAGLTDIKVVVYIREQAALASSFYSTTVKAGETALSPQQPIAGNRYDHLCNHDAMLARYSEVFGETNMLPRLFERGEIYNDSVVDDFLHTIGSENKPHYVVPENKNESLSNDGIHVLCYLNTIFPRWVPKGLNPLREDVQGYVEKQYSDSSYRMESALKIAYDDYFRDSNESVRSRYFPDRDCLFNSANKKQNSVNTANDKELLLERARQYVTQLIAEKLANVLPTLSENHIPKLGKREKNPEQNNPFLVAYSCAVASYHLNDFVTAQRVFEKLDVLDPNDADTLQYLSSSSFNIRKYSDAILSYKKLLDLDPKNNVAWLNKAKSEIELGLSDQADDSLKAGMQHCSDYFPLSSEYANYPKRTDDWQEAASRWIDVSKVFDKQLKVQYSTAVCLRESAQHELALDYFEKALQIEPDHEQALLNKAQCLTQLERYQEADVVLQKALSLNSNELIIALASANLADKMGDEETSSARWADLAVTFPTNTIALYKTGLNHYKHGQFESALVVLKQLVELDVSHQLGWHKKAQCEIELGLTKEADDTLSTALKHCSEYYPLHVEYANLPKLNKDSNTSAGRWKTVATKYPQELAVNLSAGLCMRDAADYQAAIGYFDKVLQLEPQHQQALLIKAQCLIHLTHYEEADLVLQQALSFYPKEQSIAVAYANNADKMADEEKSFARWAEVAALFPTNAKALYKTGLNHFKLNQFSPAHEALSRLVDIDVKHKLAWLKKAQCEIRLGMINEADETLAKARVHCPDHYPLHAEYANIPKLNEDWDTTASRWIEVCSIYSKEPAVQYATGVYLKKAGKFTEAIEYFNTVLELDPKHEKGHAFKRQCEVAIAS